jgi:hypothetical protein
MTVRPLELGEKVCSTTDTGSTRGDCTRSLLAALLGESSGMLKLRNRLRAPNQCGGVGGGVKMSKSSVGDGVGDKAEEVGIWRSSVIGSVVGVNAAGGDACDNAPNIVPTVDGVLSSCDDVGVDNSLEMHDIETCECGCDSLCCCSGCSGCCCCSSC